MLKCLIAKTLYAMIHISLQERVHHILKGVRHERSDVRRDALKALHKLQIECKVSFFELIVLYIKCFFNSRTSLSSVWWAVKP